MTVATTANVETMANLSRETAHNSHLLLLKNVASTEKHHKMSQQAQTLNKF